VFLSTLFIYGAFEFFLPRVEGPQIDIQDKNQLSLLRQQLEQQKREKDAAGGSTSTEVKETSKVDGGKNCVITCKHFHYGGGDASVQHAYQTLYNSSKAVCPIAQDQH
jgi:hypothetical protein